jgi:predicted NBD/HSP70 family sugar kinase
VLEPKLVHHVSETISRGQRPGDVRRVNRATALELLREHPQGRAELARAMGLSKAALGGLISDLTTEGLVLEYPPTAIARGRHPAPLQINANRFSVLGLHLAPHGLEVGLYDALGVQQDVLYAPSHVGEGIERVITQVIQTSRTLIARAKKIKIGEVTALTIATPGPLDAVPGIVLEPPRFPDLKRVNLKQKLELALKLPVRLERDVNAAATGHLRQTKANSFVYILMTGPGIGASLVINRAVYRGTHGFAGEFGHLSLDPKGLLCPCGNHGCLERYASSEAIENNYKKRSRKTASIAQIAQFARAGDPKAQAVFDDAGEAIGLAAVTLVNLFDPSQLVLASSGTSFTDLLTPSLKRQLAKRAYPYLNLGAQLNIENVTLEHPVAPGAAECALEAIYRGEISIPKSLMEVVMG